MGHGLSMSKIGGFTVKRPKKKLLKKKMSKKKMSKENVDKINAEATGRTKK
jgi:hypothetical protein